MRAFVEASVSGNHCPMSIITVFVSFLIQASNVAECVYMPCYRVIYLLNAMKLMYTESVSSPASGHMDIFYLSCENANFIDAELRLFGTIQHTRLTCHQHI